MKKFLKKSNNPYFWIGVEVSIIASVIGGFLEGRSSLKYTVIMGIIAILLIGLNLMEIEMNKQKEGMNDE